ncbi:MAG: molybdopterin-dependent oxidoreductase, partial [Chloroflexi bacterium]|nr:molybdopterin-dependent oxidoreductase [Chloroflexota bacterium]
AFTEREGTLTSGERRVQRYYPALPVRGQARADWQIFSEIGEVLGLGKSPASAAAVMLDISRSVVHYAGINYQALAKVAAQWPDVGGRDLYYGGTSFQNNGGLGVQTPTLIERGQPVAAAAVADSSAPQAELQAVPIAVLYDRSTTFVRSAVMGSHIPAAYVELNAADAARMQVANGARVRVRVPGRVAELTARVNGRAPLGVVLVPQSLGGLVLQSAQPATVERA